MFEKKAQVATEYVLITAFILVVATLMFVYSYTTNDQNIRVSQANNALDRMVNKADLVYALGPDNNQFVWATFPRGLDETNGIQDFTVCKNLTQSHNQDCTAHDDVKIGAIEMQISLIGGLSTIKRPAKAEIEMDIFCDFVGPPGNDCTNDNITPIEGRHRLKVYWCGEKICLKRA